MLSLTSRERLLRAINLQEPDYLPCCFMSFTALRKRCHENLYELAKTERGMGLDAMLFIPTASRLQRPDHPDLRGLPVRFDPGVEIREWKEVGKEGQAFLGKEYLTPAGVLRTRIRLSEDWPHGDHIPFVDDYQVPRSEKPLVTGPEDLQALGYLLIPPAPEDIAQFQKEAEIAHAFAKEQAILLAGGWGVGMDMANWLCGMQNLMVLIGVDPVQGTHTDLPLMKQKLGGRICLWGGVSGAVTMERGTEEEVRSAVREAIQTLGPGGFILSPVDNITVDAPLTWENIGIFIDEWKKRRKPQ